MSVNCVAEVMGSVGPGLGFGWNCTLKGVICGSCLLCLVVQFMWVISTSFDGSESDLRISRDLGGDFDFSVSKSFTG